MFTLNTSLNTIQTVNAVTGKTLVITYMYSQYLDYIGLILGLITLDYITYVTVRPFNIDYTQAKSPRMEFT